MELEKYIGKTILFNVRAEFARENEPLFQSAPRARLLYAKVVAVDHVGIWVENPAWRAHPVRGGRVVSHRAHVLVPWGALISVAAFPDRQFPTDQAVPEGAVSTIGFRGTSGDKR